MNNIKLSTLDDEIALLDFLFAETDKQLQADGRNYDRWQQMVIIGGIVREKFPTCLAEKIKNLPPLVPSQPNPEGDYD